jgi:S-phase kinase-associated protein 1
MNRATLIITTGDDVDFEVDPRFVPLCGTLRNMMNDLEEQEEGKDTKIPLPNVDSSSFATLLQWLAQHLDAQAAAARPPSIFAPEPQPATNPNIEARDERFCEGVTSTEDGLSPLLLLLMAANYLDVKPLMEVICAFFGNMIKGKTPEQIRETLGIENDFTPEEEIIRHENDWVSDC